jgi:solute:Na+ symporter, SSS family
VHLSTLDWTILAVFFTLLLVAAIATNRYARSVSGFLAANRCAGRYLIAVSYGMAQLGVISLVWFWQQYYDVGFTSIWWGFMENPAMILIALSGWVVYRFRQTRALTMAQFFEIRYSRRFRVFAGLVAFLSGIINYGIFPAVAARFFIALCGLPTEMAVGPWVVPTFAILMAVMLATALFFVFIGGQVAVIVTDFLQGTFGQIVFLGVMLFLLTTYSWGEIGETLLAAPEGRSMVNPFDLGQEEQFNAFYWVISVIVLFYGMLGWQGTSGYNAAAIDAHEAKMANILNGWRFRVLLLITLVLPICIRVVMTSPEHAAAAAEVQAIIAAQPANGADPAVLSSELRTPAAVSVMLPSGLLGLFAAALLGAFISTNDTYLHSWGSIFIQDVVLPFRKRPLSARAHLWLLRSSIFGVAIFAFCFSLWYTPNQYVAMFLALTGAIFVGGAGSAIIGGLYWRRATTAGAWAAMISGMSLAGFGVVVKQMNEPLIHPGGVLTITFDSENDDRETVLLGDIVSDGGVRELPERDLRFRIDAVQSSDGDRGVEVGITFVDAADAPLVTWSLSSGDSPETSRRMPAGGSAGFDLREPRVGWLGAISRVASYVRNEMSGQVLTFWSIAISIGLFVVVSILTSREPFDLDRMLHRGIHADSQSGGGDERPVRWYERLGFGHEMTRWDRIVTAVTIAWPIFFTLVFAVGLAWYFAAPVMQWPQISDEAWVEAWGWWLWFAIATAMVVTVWFTIGGFRDLVRMFRLMGQVQADERDDGRVIGHVNADEIEAGAAEGRTPSPTDRERKS